MSSSGETVEQQLEPLEVIERFEQANQVLINAAGIAHEQPSDLNLEQFDSRMSECLQLANIFGERLFFKDTGNQLAINLSIKTTFNVVDKLHSKAKQLDPEFEPEHKLMEGIEPWLEACISENDEIELSEETQAYLEKNNIPSSPDLATTIASGNYKSALKDLKTTLLSSEPVSSFLWSKNEKKLKHYTRKRTAISFGTTALAAFAGTYLANKLQRRK